MWWSGCGVEGCWESTFTLLTRQLPSSPVLQKIRMETPQKINSRPVMRSYCTFDISISRYTVSIGTVYLDIDRYRYMKIPSQYIVHIFAAVFTKPNYEIILYAKLVCV